MASSAIEYLVEMPFRWRELEKVPDDQKAALAVVCYAVSEVNALQRIYIFSAHSFTGERAIDSAIAIQRFVVLRNWSARLFEFSEFLTLGGKKPESKDEKLLELACKWLAKFEELRKTEGYELVRAVRHESTNHYSFQAAKKNLAHVSPTADGTLYLHEKQGNSFFPLGEEILFAGRINRHGANLQSTEERSKLLDVWMDWNLTATRWLSDVHLAFFNEIIFAGYPEKTAVKKAYWLDPQLVGDEQANRVPIFYRRADK